ncbi:hypothetical protein N7454_009627 [Penicillium verhagenii]|nr:hypothetical protein N7454_009627 [Penicillium verhagenii]
MLYAQWSWMRNDMNPIWFHVHVDTKFRLNCDWLSRTNDIKKAAQRLGINLQEKGADNIDTTRFKDFDINAQKEVTLKEYFNSVSLSDWSMATASLPIRAHETLEEQQSTIDNTDDHVDDHVDDVIDNGVYDENFDEISNWIETTNPLPEIEPSFESLVLGNPKLCLWCHHEGLLDAEDECHQSACMEVDMEVDMEVHMEVDMEVAMEVDNGENDRFPGVCEAADIPPLLFRWSNVDSQGINSRAGLRAGLFVDNEMIVDLDGLTKEKYLEYFVHHVTRARVSSPFISSCTGPIMPIHRALRNQRGAKVAIIDTAKLNTMVVKAQNLVPLTETRTPRWRGYGEYLIWREIPEAAVICEFAITRLEQIAEDAPDIKDFLQLELMRSQKFCSSELYVQLACRLETCKYDFLTLERLTIHLNVPVEWRGPVAEKFKEAWTRKFGSSHNFEIDQDRDDDETTAIGVYYNHKRDGKSDASGTAYAPSETNLEHSSESEESQQNTGSASPEAPARRRDTSSPPFSTQDSIDDDEPWRSNWIDEDEYLIPEGGGPQSVHLFTPSTHRREQQETSFSIAPIPIDFESEASWPPLDYYA